MGLLLFIQTHNKQLTKNKMLCTNCAQSSRAQSILNIHSGSAANPAKHAAKTVAWFEGENHGDIKKKKSHVK